SRVEGDKRPARVDIQCSRTRAMPNFGRTQGRPRLRVGVSGQVLDCQVTGCLTLRSKLLRRVGPQRAVIGLRADVDVTDAPNAEHVRQTAARPATPLP